MRHPRSQVYSGVRSRRRGGTQYATPIYRFQAGVVERRFERAAPRDGELQMKKVAGKGFVPLTKDGKAVVDRNHPIAKRNRNNDTKTYMRVHGDIESDPKECVDPKRPKASRKRVLGLIKNVLNGHGLNDKASNGTVSYLR